MFVDEEYFDETIRRRDDQELVGLNKYQRRPKLKVNKLADDKRVVSIHIDLEINNKLIIRERFDWSLDDSNVSPAKFAEKFCIELGLPESNIENMKNQIITQIIDHIERNTNPTKTKGRFYETNENEPDYHGTSLDIFAQERRDYEGESGVKQTERQRQMEEYKRRRGAPSEGKKECKYCQTLQVPISEYCKHCKIPFKFTDGIDTNNERETLAMNFLDQLIKNVDIIAEAEIEKILEIEDFQSVYNLKNMLAIKFSQLPEVKEDNLEKQLCNAIESMYKEFVSDKDKPDNTETKTVDSRTNDDSDEKESQSAIEETESPKRAEPVKKGIRKRGRPKKVPTPKKFTLRKTTK